MASAATRQRRVESRGYEGAVVGSFTIRLGVSLSHGESCLEQPACMIWPPAPIMPCCSVPGSVILSKPNVRTLDIGGLMTIIWVKNGNS